MLLPFVRSFLMTLESVLCMLRRKVSNELGEIVRARGGLGVGV